MIVMVMTVVMMNPDNYSDNHDDDDDGDNSGDDGDEDDDDDDGDNAGLEIATHWSPMRPKLEHWRLNFQNWSPAGDSRFVR